MKNRQLILLILLFILAGYTSCIKDFNPRSDKYDELLVVEGSITDKPGPYTVKLSMSGNLQKLSPYKPYSKCSVEIADDFGNQETLTEVSEGVYQTDSLGIQGVVGRKYKVKISTPDGELYESEEELLRQGVAIDTVYANQEQKNGRDGYQFYVDAANSAEGSNYYFWSLESTYKFSTDHMINFYYEGGNILNFPKPDSLFRCYKTEQIKEIFTLNTAEQSQNQVIRFPLRYEDTYTRALSIRYSLGVNQYTLSERAYIYWNTLKKMNVDQGSIFTQQPYQVKGNVKNLSNPEKPVLGYFMAAGLSQKRIFVNRLPDTLYHYPTCEYPNPNDKRFILFRLRDLHLPHEPVYIAPSETGMLGAIVWGAIVGVDIDSACVDCRVTGYLRKPKFWID